MTKPRHFPLESFGNELLQILLKAAREKVTLTFPKEKGGYATATVVRQRLYGLRNSMRKNNHEHYNLVSGLIAKIAWDPSEVVEKVGRNMVPQDRKAPVTLVIDHRDRELKEIAVAAGIVDTHVVDDAPATSAEPTAPSKSKVLPIKRISEDDILARILDGKV